MAMMTIMKEIRKVIKEIKKIVSMSLAGITRKHIPLTGKGRIIQSVGQ